MKYVVAVGGILIVVIAAGYYIKYGTGAPAGELPQAPANTTMGVATSTYATSTYSIVYPQDFTVDETYVNTEVNPKKPIHGVSFTIPGTMATGTNLSADTHVAVEQLPRAKKCTADIYLQQNVKPVDTTDGGVAYSVATTSDAGAGNFYEEMVYALSGSSPCTAVRYFIHSSNIQNYPDGAVKEFDHAALLSAFDSIRQSLQLQGGMSATPMQQ